MSKAILHQLPSNDKRIIIVRELKGFFDHLTIEIFKKAI